MAVSFSEMNFCTAPVSINSKSLIKLIGPTTSKFTPKNNRFHIIDSKLFGSKDINTIKPDDVIDYINSNTDTYNDYNDQSLIDYYTANGYSYSEEDKKTLSNY